MTQDEARMWLDAEYPNLSAILIGCVSGHHTEWPAMRSELVRLVTEIVRLREALTKTRRELWHCNEQLKYRGATEGYSVTEALQLADEVLTQEPR